MQKASKLDALTAVVNGDPTRTRTWDPMVKSHLLYRLSYRTTTVVNAWEIRLSSTECKILPSELRVGKFVF